MARITFAPNRYCQLSWEPSQATIADITTAQAAFSRLNARAHVTLQRFGPEVYSPRSRDISLIIEMYFFDGEETNVEVRTHVNEDEDVLHFTFSEFWALLGGVSNGQPQH